MAARYQHLIQPVLDGVAERLGQLLWPVAEGPTETQAETIGPDEASA
jgi:hypothetical protein